MTPEQESQFNDFGCVSRSTLKFLELTGQPMTKNDFVARFEKFFPPGQFGLLSLDNFCRVVKELKLCEQVFAVRNRKIAKNAAMNGQGVFVLTDLGIDQDGNVNGDLFHCRLLLKMSVDPNNPDDFLNAALFCPNQDGTDDELWFPRELLEKMLVHFIVLG